MLIRAQHTFQHESGVAEDRFVNVFHINAPDLITTTDLDDLCAAIRDFYTGTIGGGVADLSTFLSPRIDAAGRSIKLYDMADPMPRGPIRVLEPAPVAFGGSPLPEELAICLSYAASPSSGISPARRRGRIYFGPLNVSTMPTPGVGTDSHPSVAVRTSLCAAGAKLQSDFNDVGCQWVVHSTVSAGNATITRCWADDAWDIQRRRGLRPTSRVAYDPI